MNMFLAEGGHAAPGQRPAGRLAGRAAGRAVGCLAGCRWLSPRACAVADRQRRRHSAGVSSEKSRPRRVLSLRNCTWSWAGSLGRQLWRGASWVLFLVRQRWRGASWVLDLVWQGQHWRLCLSEMAGYPLVCIGEPEQCIQSKAVLAVSGMDQERQADKACPDHLNHAGAVC